MHFINYFQSCAHKEDINTMLFNITQLQYQDQVNKYEL